MNPDTFAQIVSVNVRSRRLALGWSRSELARKSRVGRSTIIRIEEGKFSPQTRTLSKFAKAFKCEVVDLFEQPRRAPKAGGSR